MKTGLFRKTLDNFLTLLYPPRCVSCGEVLPRKMQALCESCEKRFDTESKMPCPKCGKAHSKCDCVINPEFEKVKLIHVTGYDMKRDSVSRNIILRLKDDNIKSGFDFVSERMAEALLDRISGGYLAKNCLVTFVPRSKKAKRKAGHDQAEILARNISRITGAEFADLLTNLSHKMQKKLGKEKRLENAIKSYCLKDDTLRLDGKHLIIVDDIVTTGASIGVCSRLLISAGAKDVTALVYARTQNARVKTDII